MKRSLAGMHGDSGVRLAAGKGQELSASPSGMPMTGRKAVIFAAHPWSGVPYGLHHIARALARLGWRVLYVEPSFSPLHLLGGRRRGRVFNRRPRPTDEPGVALISPFTLAPHVNVPILRSPAALFFGRHLSWPRIGARYLARTSYAKPDLVLCGSPIAGQDALSLAARMSVYRLADDSKLFDVLAPAARQAEAHAISLFEAVIATSPVLEARARELNNRRVLLVSNGVDKGFFERPVPAPPVMFNIPKPRILYAGAVESWFDWTLVAHAARERPFFNFAIVGRVQSSPPVDLPSNVHLIGPRPYSEMPAFMQASSVGVIPFTSKRHGEAVAAINPLKLYEYLAAGIPVVSSVQPPNVHCDGVFLFKSEAEFLEGLDEAVNVGANGAKIKVPDHLDWTEIVSKMLNELLM